MTRISFRAVSRVLKVLAPYLGLKKGISHQTVINWITRFALSRIERVPSLIGVSKNDSPPFLSNDCLWLIDISIALGAGKILAVLCLDVHHYQNKNHAPTLQDLHCIAVAVSLSWTGEKVAEFLEKVIAQLGVPCGFLKDQGSELAKSARLLREKEIDCPEIDDVSHVIANLLKHEYEHHSKYNTFLSVCGKTSQKLKQTLLAFLAPPKISTKARFMNLHRLVRWSGMLLKHSPVGRVARDSFIEKLRQSMVGLPECKGFIRRFLRDATALLACQKLLKTEGLSFATNDKCDAILEQIPYTSPIYSGFMNWKEIHLNIAESLGVADRGLPITTDPIESTFGVVKKHGVGAVKDANRIALHIPALCGSLKHDDGQRVLEVSVKKEQEFLGSSISSLTRQRRKILPNPGSLKESNLDELYENIELIPGAQNRLKTANIQEILGYCKNTHGPDIGVENIPTLASIGCF